VIQLQQIEAAGPLVDYNAVRRDIAKAIQIEDDKRTDGTSIAPTLIRLAWHAAGTYSKLDGTGGSNGATMRYSPESNWGANAGLAVARNFLDPIKAAHPGITYADLWTLAGVVAVEEMGGPKVPWRAGRADFTGPEKCPPDGRLPDADKGNDVATTQHIRDIFGRMGFTDREMVALIGAHAVGRCHVENSGYWGPWTRAESTFSNQFFRMLLDEKWRDKKTHNGKPWKGPKQFESQDAAIMMLPADMMFAKDPAFRQYVELYANDEQAFFKDFSAAFGKLLELGTPMTQSQGILGWLRGLFGL
jgi:cytochrome c peroxidase